MTLRRSGPPERRTPLRDSTPLATSSARLRRGKPLAPRSGRRIDEDELWRAVKRLVEHRDGGRCRAEPLVPEVACAGRLHPHHVWPVGRGGPRLDPDNVITACAAHHRWIHDGSPALARSRGLLR